MQLHLLYKISAKSHHKHEKQNATNQHDKTVGQLSVNDYSSRLLVQCDRRRGAGASVYHMAPSRFLEFKNLRLLS